MILASHIIISGILGSETQNYFFAGVIGLVSHYVLDAIPHWDFYLSPNFGAQTKIKDGGFVKERIFWKEISKVVIDIAIGFGLLFIFANFYKNTNTVPLIISGVFSILPDALILLYWITNWKFLKWNFDIQEFAHNLTRSKTNSSFRFGIITQIATIGIVFLMLYKL
ncbi:MAG: hypothetical protein Q7J30_02645 [Candidatus Azambacteria bacterium]|nr:hypothetical protein [Candidatus Azambacteria bacterium]